MPIELTDFAHLAPDERAEIEAVVSHHHGLDDIFEWGRRQQPVVVPADVVKQDEYTHDVLVPLPSGRWLVYGTT